MSGIREPAQQANQEVRQLLEQANQYAAAKQWGNAATLFSAVTDRLYAIDDGFRSLSPIPDLKRALSLLAQPGRRADERDMAWPTISLHADAAEPFRVLARALDVARGATHVSAFQWADRWTVAFHRQASSRLDLTFPAAPSASYVLDLVAREGAESLRARTASPRIAYALSHLAEASVNVTIALYQEHQILIDKGIQAILAQAQRFLHALVLAPDHAWTWARLGDTYRSIANRWPGSMDALRIPKVRIHDYCLSLVCLHRAIEIYGEDNPAAFWALSHFGAAIVNVRGFLGCPQALSSDLADGSQALSHVSHPGGADGDPGELTALIDGWLGEDLAVETPVRWMDYALTSLVKAQQARGFYYPWAQSYHSAAMLVKAALLQSSGRRSNLALLSGTQAATAYYYDPTMLTTVMEPGELQVNPHFEMAMVFYRARQWSLAWQFARVGMYYPFKYNFLPGLQSLTGCHILALAAARAGERGAGGEDEDEDEDDDILTASRLSVAQDPVFPIPNRRIQGGEALRAFIDGAFKAHCLPAVTPFLANDVPINTKVAVGLSKALQILCSFVNILPEAPRLDGEARRADPIEEKLEDCIGRIADKLGFPLRDGRALPGATKGELLPLFSGTPSYHFMQGLVDLANAQPSPGDSK